MLQIDPTKRIAIGEIKKHPYFNNVDFDEVSSEGYCEAKALVLQKFEEVKKEKAEKAKEGNDLEISLMQSTNFNGGLIDHMDGVSYLPVMDPTTIVLKGFLLKDNWYGNKQKRYFELYPEGIIKYFEIKGRIRIYKGCLSLGASTQLINQQNQIRFVCDRKRREYCLMQPPQAKIGSFQK